MIRSPSSVLLSAGKATKYSKLLDCYTGIRKESRPRLHKVKFVSLSRTSQWSTPKLSGRIPDDLGKLTLPIPFIRRKNRSCCSHDMVPPRTRLFAQICGHWFIRNETARQAWQVSQAGYSKRKEICPINLLFMVFHTYVYNATLSLAYHRP